MGGFNRLIECLMGCFVESIESLVCSVEDVWGCLFGYLESPSFAGLAFYFCRPSLVCSALLNLPTLAVQGPGTGPGGLVTTINGTGVTGKKKDSKTHVFVRIPARI